MPYSLKTLLWFILICKSAIMLQRAGRYGFMQTDFRRGVATTGIARDKEPWISPFSSGTATIVDHLFERDNEEFRRFEILYRIFFFSLLVIIRNKKHPSLINDLITTNPTYMPDLLAQDLWLQRMVVKLNGLPDSPAIREKIRPELIEYYQNLKANHFIYPS
ncbi:hypothetical protein ACFLZM_07175 [Thermodesulfobacteriota bacterium]